MRVGKKEAFELIRSNSHQRRGGLPRSDENLRAPDDIADRPEDYFICGVSNLPAY